MISAHDLDYAPLARRGRLRAQLAAIGGSVRLTIAATVIVPLLVAPAIAVVIIVATVADIDWGVISMLAFLLLCGVWAAADLLAQAGVADALTRFAEANDLEALPAVEARGYAGSLFAAGSHRVHQGVRTRDDHFVEVGERFPRTVAVSSVGQEDPALYLRARLSGRTAPLGDVELVTPDLHERLVALAGSYETEVSGDELTVFGTRRLESDDPRRVAEAFAVLLDLVARAEDLLVTPATRAPATTLSGIPLPARHRPVPTSTRPRRTLTVVTTMLAVLVLGPLGLALLMSSLEDGLRGNDGVATVVVGLVVAGLVAVVGLVIRWLLTPRRTDRERAGDETSED